MIYYSDFVRFYWLFIAAQFLCAGVIVISLNVISARLKAISDRLPEPTQKQKDPNNS